MGGVVRTWEFWAIVGLVAALLALFVHAARGGLRRGENGDTGAWSDFDGGGDGGD